MAIEGVSGGGTTTPDAHDDWLQKEESMQDGSEANLSHYRKKFSTYETRGRPNPCKLQ